MANTKSAERRMRSSARKQERNKSVKSRLKTLQLKLLATVEAGKKTEAATVLREVSSALDKGAKAGVITKENASRKKSRLAVRVASMK